MKRALVLSGGGARGSFQAGVWKYLTEIGWEPDILCGTSIGAINAAAIASGMDVSTMIHLWTFYNRRKIYHPNFLQFCAHLISGKKLKPMLDTRMLKKMIRENLDFSALKKSRKDVIITAVNLLTGQPEFFNHQEIEIEHLLASSAMPLLFPVQKIGTQPYWDGGVIMNTPVSPAIDYGAEEIIVVLLSPVSHKKQKRPLNFINGLEHLLEHFLSGSFQTSLANYGLKEKAYTFANCPKKTDRLGCRPEIKLITLAPSKMLGLKSLLNFSKEQAVQLLQEGYDTARKQLENRLSI